MNAHAKPFLDAARDIAVAPYVEREREAEAFRLSAHNAEAAQHRGACWSGMGPGSFRARTEAQIEADALKRAAEIDAFRNSNTGKARAAIAQGCRKSESLHAALMDIGTALSRGDGSAIRKAEDAAEVLHALRLLVADAEAFVRLVAAEGGA